MWSSILFGGVCSATATETVMMMMNAATERGIMNVEL